ncbi:anaphase promoting complex subunit cdc16, partial [Podochytrium sp. JEL0797]
MASSRNTGLPLASRRAAATAPVAPHQTANAASVAGTRRVASTANARRGASSSSSLSSTTAAAATRSHAASTRSTSTLAFNRKHTAAPAIASQHQQQQQQQQLQHQQLQHQLQQRHNQHTRIAAWAADAFALGLVEAALHWAQLAIDLRDKKQTPQPALLLLVLKALEIHCDFDRIIHQITDTHPEAIHDHQCRFILIQALKNSDRNEEAMKYINLDYEQFSAPVPVEKSNASAGQRESQKNQTSPSKIDGKARALYLRGAVHNTMSEKGLAKQAFKDALMADVRCFEAFSALISRSMLTVQEELELLESLPFTDHCGLEDGALVRLLYSTQLKKYGRTAQVETDLQVLETTYQLSSNAGVLQSRAELYAMQGKYELALEKTDAILKLDPHNQPTLLTHLHLLYSLSQKNTLFLLAHRLIATSPSTSVAWYAVGCYYLLIGKLVEAKQAFGKSCKVDAEFGEGWVALGHALSLEGSWEQAVHAYGVGAKCFEGVHLPTLFIGMQYTQFGQSAVGEEFVKTAHGMCGGADWLVENELGVAAYKAAIQHFVKAIVLAGPDASHRDPFDSVWCNLGNSYRSLRFFKRAKISFENALIIQPQYATALACLGIVEDRVGNYGAAILHYHK